MQKMKIVVFGVGEIWRKYRENLADKYEIVALIDSSVKANEQAVIDGYTCLCPNDIFKIKWNKVLILPPLLKVKMEIVEILLSLGVAKSDIILYLADAQRYWGNAVLKLSETGLHGQFGELVFDAESESDYNIVQEVYLDLEYGCCTGAEKLLVLDMGMNIGLASLFYVAKPEVTAVYGFEPFGPTYEQALKNFQQNPRHIQEKLHPQRMGLSNREQTLCLAYNQSFSGGMSIYGQQTVDGEPMQLREASEVLAPILSKRDHQKVLAKIDVEGSEYDILSNLAASQLLNEIDFIIMETHFAREREALDILQKNGFSYFLNSGPAGLGVVRAMRR